MEIRGARVKGRVILGVAASVVALVSGCTSANQANQSESPGNQSEAPRASAPAEQTSDVAVAKNRTKVTIDNVDYVVEDDVLCGMEEDKFVIMVRSPTYITAAVTPGDSPTVRQVTLGDVGGNGIQLVYGEGANHLPGHATATKDGSTYRFSGEATGYVMPDPTQQVYKPFALEVTCP